MILACIRRFRPRSASPLLLSSPGLSASELSACYMSSVLTAVSTHVHVLSTGRGGNVYDAFP